MLQTLTDVQHFLSGEIFFILNQHYSACMPDLTDSGSTLLKSCSIKECNELAEGY